MPMYLVRGKYTAESAQGLRKAGAAHRVEAIRQMFESVGGTLVSDPCWSATDLSAVGIVELPSEAAAAAVLSTALASGTQVSVQVERLVTAAELVAALGVNVQYRPPGQ